MTSIYVPLRPFNIPKIIMLINKKNIICLHNPRVLYIILKHIITICFQNARKENFIKQTDTKMVLYNIQSLL